MAQLGEWSNWAGDQRCRPARVAAPRTVEELAEAIGAAARGMADDREILMRVAGDNSRNDARAERLAQVFQRLALASDRDHASGAHRDRQHHRA